MAWRHAQSCSRIGMRSPSWDAYPLLPLPLLLSLLLLQRGRCERPRSRPQTAPPPQGFPLFWAATPPSCLCGTVGHSLKKLPPTNAHSHAWNVSRHTLIPNNRCSNTTSPTHRHRDSHYSELTSLYQLSLCRRGKASETKRHAYSSCRARFTEDLQNKHLFQVLKRQIDSIGLLQR